MFPRLRSPTELTPDEARAVERAWQRVLAGRRPRRGEATPASCCASSPGSVAGGDGPRLRAPARRTAPRGAAARFAAVLARRPDYVPALVGAAPPPCARATARRALQPLRRAAAVDPANETVRRRLAELRLQVTERRVAAAREAAGRGRRGRRRSRSTARALDAAPEVPRLRLELADLLVPRGDAARRVAVLEADPTADRQVLLRLGELLAGRREYERALEAYRRILDRDPRDEEALRRSREVREAMELLQMPEEYRRIAVLAHDHAGGPGRPRDGEGDRAVPRSRRGRPRSPSTSRAPGRATTSSARSPSTSSTVYPNHTFQPGAIVRRGDLAAAVQRVLDLLKHPAGAPRRA